MTLKQVQQVENDAAKKVEKRIKEDDITREAEEEGFKELAFKFRMVAQVFEKSDVKVWECRNCGHIVVGTKAPEVCPVCAHPQSYFELHAENY